MNRYRNMLATTLYVLAFFCVSMLGNAQMRGPSIADRVGNVLDNVAAGLNLVGEKTDQLTGRGLTFGEGDFIGFTQAREFSENYPVAPTANVSLANEFGAIRVEVWDSPVVRVGAAISVKAESVETARKVAADIQIAAEPGPAKDRLAVRTVLPDVPREVGKVRIEVNYTLTLPREAAAQLVNYFGDTTVRGVGGNLGINAQYGVVDIANIGGEVTLRSRGEGFAVMAAGLRKGGTFDLYGSQAEFSDLAGTVRIGVFRGALTVKGLAADSIVEAVAESGSLDYVLGPQDVSPKFEATALFGKIESAVEVVRTTLGDAVVARSAEGDERRRLTLRSSFGDINIRREGPTPANATLPLLEGAEPVKEIATLSETLEPGAKIKVEGGIGDITVEGADVPQVRIVASKLAWVRDHAAAPASLAALFLQVAQNPGEMLIRSTVQGDLAQLGCRAHRIDITLQIPREAPVEITAIEGSIRISGHGGPVGVKLGSGAVSAKGLNGVCSIAVDRGDIEVLKCAGAVTAETKAGSISATEASAPLKIVSNQGRVVVENPKAEIDITATRGDVRLIALEGPQGDVTVNLTDGNLSMLLGPASNVALAINVANGVMTSNLPSPLTGSISKGVYEFMGRLNDGLHRITCNVRNGDVRLD